MIVLNGSNVNGLYRLGRQLLLDDGVGEKSRAGNVWVVPHPVMSVYRRPQERVLFDAARDANPFFHLMESIWMLAGRDDPQWLDQFVADFSKRFAEEDGTMHGAYGYRWRYKFGLDQLNVVVDRLRKDPNDRRVVISMWDTDTDLLEPDYVDDETGDIFPEPRDLPCNTHLYPRIVNSRLDITICCRSNDIIWGAYGANAVHFSVLQEYLAAAIGVKVGTMYQLSNNFHGYVDVLDKTRPTTEFHDPYALDEVTSLPMVTDPLHFVGDCEQFCFTEPEKNLSVRYANEWFATVAAPMRLAALRHRQRDHLAALEMASRVAAPDWQRAAVAWLERHRRVVGRV
jgi:thymidylate synthase